MREGRLEEFDAMEARAKEIEAEAAALPQDEDWLRRMARGERSQAGELSAYAMTPEGQAAKAKAAA